jgi:hypothetical protein
LPAAFNLNICASIGFRGPRGIEGFTATCGFGSKQTLPFLMKKNVLAYPIHSLSAELSVRDVIVAPQ